MPDTPPMKRALLAMLAVSVLTGCSFIRYTYNVDLSGTEGPREFAIKDEPGKKDQHSSTVHYDDKLAMFLVMFSPDSIDLTIKNKSDGSLRVLWDEAAITGADGTTGRVIHKGVRYIERDASMPPSVIPKGATLSDFVVPSASIFYNESLKQWDRIPMLPTEAPVGTKPEDAATRVASYQGKTITLLLPIEAANKKHEYLFKFVVKKAAVKP